MGAGGSFVAEPMLPTSPTVRGLRVAGEQLEVGEDPRAWVEAQDRAFRTRSVVLKHGELTFETTYGELGAGIDVGETVKAIVAVGHTGSVIKRLRQTRRARRGEIDVPFEYTIDPATARRQLRGLAARDTSTKHVAAGAHHRQVVAAQVR